MKRFLRNGLVTGLLFGTASAMTGPTTGSAQEAGKKDLPQPVQPPLTDRTGAIIIPLQSTQRIQMKSRKTIRGVVIDKDTVVDARTDVSNPAILIFFGKGVGTTKVELTDIDGGRETIEVIVQPDIELLRNLIRRTVPTANVDVIPAGGGLVILTGSIAKNEDSDTILRVAGAVLGTGPQGVINAMTIGGVQQVQLDVTIARVDRTKARNRGFNFNFTPNSFFNLSSTIGGLAQVIPGMGAAGGAGTGGAGSTIGTSSAANVVFGIIPTFNGVLQALKTEGLAKTLAEPKLIVQSGREGRFLAGGQQAVVSAASGINGAGVAYQEVGTELRFLPIVYGNGKIFLQVEPRVRGVNQGLGITTPFGNSPGFDEQSISTSVVMEPGQTFAIGGLIQTNQQGSTIKIPVLGEIPYLGTLFSVTSYTEQETELVILITPHLVDPMDCRQVPQRLPGAESRRPDDYEFYLELMLELPRGQRNVFENKKYKAGYKNDPAGAFPCGPAYNANSGFPANTLGDRIHGVAGHGGVGANCATGTCAPATGTTPYVGAASVSPKATMPTIPTGVSTSGGKRDAIRDLVPNEPIPAVSAPMGSELRVGEPVLPGMPVVPASLPKMEVETEGVKATPVPRVEVPVQAQPVAPVIGNRPF